MIFQNGDKNLQMAVGLKIIQFDPIFYSESENIYFQWVQMQFGQEKTIFNDFSKRRQKIKMAAVPKIIQFDPPFHSESENIYFQWVQMQFRQETASFYNFLMISPSFFQNGRQIQYGDPKFFVLVSFWSIDLSFDTKISSIG